jgi:hypothetical protein
MILKSSKAVLSLAIAGLVGCGGGSSSVSSSGQFEYSFAEDTTQHIQINYDITKLELIDNPSHGTVTWDLETDSILYVPNAEYSGDDYFKVVYQGGNKQQTISYNMHIESANDAPVISTPDSIVRKYHNVADQWIYQLEFSDVEDSGFIYNENVAPDDAKNKMFVELVFNNLELDEGQDVNGAVLNYGEFSYNRATQIITHTTSQVELDYSQTLTMKVTDSEGLFVTKDIVLDIDYINTAPEFTGEVDYSIVEDTQTVLALDTFISDEDMDEWTVTLDNTNSVGTFVYEDDNITYTPPVDFFGHDEITFTITDVPLAKTEVTINIDVERFIDTLVVDNFNPTINEDTNYETTITYVDNENLATEDIMFSIKQQPEKGTVQLSEGGVIKYVPFENANGADQLTVRVYDNVGRSEDSIVNITITPLNDPISIDQAMEFTTVGNLHIKSNLMSHVSDVDGDNLSFVVDTYNAAGASLIVASNGDMEFYPPLHEKNKLFNYSVAISDGTNIESVNVSVLVEDRLIKIIDEESLKANSDGSALSPYKSAEIAFTELSEGDELYFCSNDIDVTATITIPENVSFVGYNKQNKHEFTDYCESASADNMTALTINDGIEIEINSDLIMKNIKINNISATAVVVSTDVMLENVSLENLDVSQVNPAALFLDLDAVSNIAIKTSSFYNGEKVIDLANLSGDVILESLTIEDIDTPIVLDGVSNNTNMELKSLNINGFIKAISYTSIDATNAVSFNVSDSIISTMEDNSLAIERVIENDRNMIIEIKKNTLKASRPITSTHSNSSDLIVNVEENYLVAQNTASMTENYIEAGVVDLTVNNNEFNIANALDNAEIASYLNISGISGSLVSEYNILVKDNAMRNSGAYSLNNKPGILYNLNADTSNIKLVTDVVGNAIDDADIDHLDMDFSSSTLNVDANINIENNNFKNSLYNSIEFKELNMVESCINIQGNELANVDLNNEDIGSQVSLYDPENDMELSLYNRQVLIGDYASLANYGFTFNACEKIVSP